MHINRRNILRGVSAISITTTMGAPVLAQPHYIIDGIDRPHPTASSGNNWELVSDTVMGGVSNGTMKRHKINGRTALQMQGDVSLENNGGFIQIALDLGNDQSAINTSHWKGIQLDVLGNTEEYNMHLRTVDVTRPWQSYRQSFLTKEEWTTLKLPFSKFTNYRIDAPLNLSALRRIGIVAIGRAFHADISISDLRFYS